MDAVSPKKKRRKEDTSLTKKRFARKYCCCINCSNHNGDNNGSIDPNPRHPRTGETVRMHSFPNSVKDKERLVGNYLISVKKKNNV